MRFHGWRRLERSGLGPRRTSASAAERREDRDAYEQNRRTNGDAESLHVFSGKLSHRKLRLATSESRQSKARRTTRLRCYRQIERRGSWDCLASEPNIRLKKGSQARAGLKPPARVFASGSLGRLRRYWRRQASATRGSRCRICDRPRPQSRLPFRTRPRDCFRLRFTMSSEAAPCRWRSCASA